MNWNHIFSEYCSCENKNKFCRMESLIQLHFTWFSCELEMSKKYIIIWLVVSVLFGFVRAELNWIKIHKLIKCIRFVEVLPDDISGEKRKWKCMESEQQRTQHIYCPIIININKWKRKPGQAAARQTVYLLISQSARLFYGTEKFRLQLLCAADSYRDPYTYTVCLCTVQQTAIKSQPHTIISSFR